jgi:hypothetical protein
LENDLGNELTEAENELEGENDEDVVMGEVSGVLFLNLFKLRHCSIHKYRA